MLMCYFVYSFVSATWPQGVRRLAQSYMKNPIQVCVGSLDLAAVHTVTQKICMINEDEKLDMVSSILKWIRELIHLFLLQLYIISFFYQLFEMI